MGKETSGSNKPHMRPDMSGHLDAAPASKHDPVSDRPSGKHPNGPHQIGESDPDVPKPARPIAGKTQQRHNLPSISTDRFPTCSRQHRSFGDNPEHFEHAGAAPDCTHWRTVVKVTSCQDATTRSRSEPVIGKSALSSNCKLKIDPTCTSEPASHHYSETSAATEVNCDPYGD